VELPAGRLESRTREFSLRTLVGLETEEDFRNLVIARGEDGHLVRLGEVARVERAAENERSYSRLNGRPGIMLAIEAQSKGNTLDIARGVREEVARIQDTLPAGTSLVVSIDNAVSVEAALREVLIAVVFALISVLIVIYWRSRLPGSRTWRRRTRRASRRSACPSIATAPPISASRCRRSDVPSRRCSARASSRPTSSAAASTT